MRPETHRSARLLPSPIAYVRDQSPVWEVSRHEAWSVKGESLWASGGRARVSTSQPPELRIEVGALEEIRRRVVAERRRVVVLDDDPTGVHTERARRASSYHLQGIEDLRWAPWKNKPHLLHPDQLPQYRGGRGDDCLNQQIARNFPRRLPRSWDGLLDVVSRSDSTPCAATTRRRLTPRRCSGREGVDPTALSCAPLSEAGRITVDESRPLGAPGCLASPGRTNRVCFRPVLWLPLLGPQGVGRGE